MPISIKTDLEWGQKMYLKDDPVQLEHSLVGVILKPGKAVKFELSHQGEICEVFDFEASTKKDELKRLLDEPE
jgi:hypothetical protein